jgi:hypothetical protein
MSELAAAHLHQCAVGGGWQRGRRCRSGPRAYLRSRRRPHLAAFFSLGTFADPLCGAFNAACFLKQGAMQRGGDADGTPGTCSCLRIADRA